MEVLLEASVRVGEALSKLPDWGPSGQRAGQYRSDLVADEAAIEVLRAAGLGVLSEESGLTGEEAGELIAVLDPLDGSTNAARGIPWFATSICVVDRDGPLAAVVVNQALHRRYEAVRGRGALRDGEPCSTSGATALQRSVMGVSGYPPERLGWRQYRALGAAALDLCAVADGTLDAYADCGPAGHGVWDYLAGALICSEAGGGVADGSGDELVVLEVAARRSPVAAATPELLEEVTAAWRAVFPGPTGSRSQGRGE